MKYKSKHSTANGTDMGTALFSFTSGQDYLGTALHGDSIIQIHMGTALLGGSFAWGQLPTFVLKTLPWWLSKHCTRPA